MGSCFFLGIAPRLRYALPPPGGRSPPGSSQGGCGGPATIAGAVWGCHIPRLRERNRPYAPRPTSFVGYLLKRPRVRLVAPGPLRLIADGTDTGTRGRGRDGTSERGFRGDDR